MTATLTVGGKTPRLDIYLADLAVMSDRLFTNKLLDHWDRCIATHQSCLKAVKRADKLEAKIEASDLSWNHPHRVEANLLLGERTEERDRSLIDYKHALACFVGLIQTWHLDDVRAQLQEAATYAGRTDPASVTLLESVYREPDLVEGQRLWPEMIEVYEHRLPEHMRIDYWRDQREIAERQRQDAIKAGRRIAEPEWRGMFRQMVKQWDRLDAVPF